MTFIFETSEINTRLYTRMIRKNMYCQFTDRKRRNAFFKWLNSRNYRFIIRPSHTASEDPFFSKNGVGGITDPQKMILYLEDSKTVNQDFVKRVLRQNAIVISHEFGHLKGLWNGNNDKKPLRNIDESNTPAGTLLNEFVQEVHDRDIENKGFTLNFWFWDWIKFSAHKYNVRVIDFRDIFE